MFGISYGELFLLIGATAALVGPKDLPKIARVAGRLAGRSIGYVQLARGQFDNVMQQSQARQVHKDLQDTMAQLDAIRHEIRSLSLVNPGPMTRRLMENPPEPASDSNVTVPPEICEEEKNSTDTLKKIHPSRDYNSKSFSSTDLHSQATAYARLAESESLKAGSVRCDVQEEDLKYEFGDFSVLPVSAETAGLLPDRKEGAKGSDHVLEAVVEAEVARNAKEFFSLPQNQIQ
ncbi:mitochondrial TatB-like [Hibiscus trionum]|uniref:Mitochondrial TatB-like n=1 Tax=Hibiscus trionum TaxID=183268 RepID=A0A9W7GR86_HIBTR|nr:mitochondrial TatB-like [Hibiscus trionum]